MDIQDGQFISNGETVDFDCQYIGDHRFHLIINDRSINAELVDMDKSKSTFTFLVNGVEIELNLEDKFDLLLDQLGMEKGAGSNVKNIQAPMPGLVLQVNVAVGDTVDNDAPLLVLEAMKMENVIKSPKETTIASIEVEVGQKVEKGQILVVFDS